MHEYSIVQALLEKTERLAQENDATKVLKLVIKIGVMSGVEPHLLEIAFDTFKEKTICDGAELVMDIQPLTITCQECGTRSELETINYCCPDCGSVNIHVVDGEEMFLMTLEME